MLKNEYKSPCLINLNDQSALGAQCTDTGSSADTPVCFPTGIGEGACNDGASANPGCSAGSSAQTNCSVGTLAECNDGSSASI